MNLHHVTFEKLLEICGSLEDPDKIKGMIEALDLLEKNLRYMRQRLVGQLNMDERRRAEEKTKERQRLKQSFRVLKPKKPTGRSPGSA